MDKIASLKFWFWFQFWFQMISIRIIDRLYIVDCNSILWIVIPCDLFWFQCIRVPNTGPVDLRFVREMTKFSVKADESRSVISILENYDPFYWCTISIVSFLRVLVHLGTPVDLRTFILDPEIISGFCLVLVLSFFYLFSCTNISHIIVKVKRFSVVPGCSQIHRNITWDIQSIKDVYQKPFRIKIMDNNPLFHSTQIPIFSSSGSWNDVLQF